MSRGLWESRSWKAIAIALRASARYKPYLRQLSECTPLLGDVGARRRG
jgi:hypothetical protein